MSLLIERLETRRLLAHVGLDVNYGAAGEAPAGGSVLLEALPDGKVIAVESAQDRPGYRVTRLNADGTIDPTFKDALADGALGVQAVISGSRVIVATHVFGNFFAPPQIQLRAIRLADGSADTTFGVGGIVTFTSQSFRAGYAPYNVSVYSMAAASDGGLLLGIDQFIERTTNPRLPTHEDVVYKLDAAGHLDPTFAGNGVLIPGTDDRGFPILAADPAGGFLMINRGKLTRHLDDGSLDTRFGDGGSFDLINLRPGTSFASWDKLFVQPDGKILVTIQSNPDRGGAAWLGRLNADGSIDMSFGTNGIAEPSLSDGFFWDVTFDSAGRVLAFGGLDQLFRITPDGKADLTFDDDGLVQVHPSDQLSSLAVDSAGGILVGSSISTVRLVARDPIARGRDGVVHVDGTDGNDTITASRAGDQVTVVLNGQPTTFVAADVTGFRIDTRLGNDSVDVAVDVDTFVETHSDFGSFIRTAGGDDSIIGSQGHDTISTGAGDDSVLAGSGNDTVDGGAGHDTIIGEDGNDSLVGGAGDDKIYGQNGQDTIAGGAGRDWLYGGSPFSGFFNDAADSIAGGDGDDYLYGNEHLNIGTNDTLDGGDGNNILNSSHLAGITITGNVLRFDGLAGDDEISVYQTEGVNQYVISIDGAEEFLEPAIIHQARFFGYDGDDLLRLNKRLPWAATLDGGAGDDELSAGLASDSLLGGDGNDLLYGHAGNDSLDGGFGDDVMYGYDGIDQVDYSSRTADLVVGLDGFADDGEAGELDLAYSDIERVLGGSGNDRIGGAAGLSLLYGNEGDDTLGGGAGADGLYGGAGRDLLEGGDGDDYLEGGSGHDVMYGGTGADLLFGLAGNDELFTAGDGTRDTVRGGLGFDIAEVDALLDDVLSIE